MPVPCGPRCSGPPPSPADMPGGSARRRISSNCARAAICWANSAVWMPWNSPSSQPTSWAWAMRSSDSDGIASSANGSESRSSSSISSGARPSSSSLIERRWISLSRDAARLVERGAAHLLEQLLDHAADAHDLGRLVDEVGERALVVALAARRHLDRHAVGTHDHDPRGLVGTARRRAVGASEESAGPEDRKEKGWSLMTASSRTTSRAHGAHRITVARAAVSLRSSRPVNAAALHRRPVAVDDLPARRSSCSAACDTRRPRPHRTSRRPRSRATCATRDLERQGWYDDAGALVAYGWVPRVGDSPKVELDAYVHPVPDVAIGVELVAALEDRGRALAAEAGHDHARLRHRCLPAGRAHSRRGCAARGFEVGTTFTRMRIDFDGPLEPTAADRRRDRAPVRTRTRPTFGSRTRLDEESFTEHYGHVAQDFDRVPPEVHRARDLVDAVAGRARRHAGGPAHRHAAVRGGRRRGLRPPPRRHPRRPRAGCRKSVAAQLLLRLPAARAASPYSCMSTSPT